MTTVIDGTTGIDKVKDGSIVQSDIAAPFYLPSPQTWQVVTGSRVLGTTYTNNTGQLIFARLTCYATVLELLSITPTVGGIALVFSSMYAPGVGYTFTVLTPIPAGATYSFACSKASVVWEELR